METDDVKLDDLRNEYSSLAKKATSGWQLMRDTMDQEPDIKD